jgi:hypothetical protein
MDAAQPPPACGGSGLDGAMHRPEGASLPRASRRTPGRSTGFPDRPRRPGRTRGDRSRGSDPRRGPSGGPPAVAGAALRPAPAGRATGCGAGRRRHRRRTGTGGPDTPRSGAPAAHAPGRTRRGNTAAPGALQGPGSAPSAVRGRVDPTVSTSPGPGSPRHRPPRWPILAPNYRGTSVNGQPTADDCRRIGRPILWDSRREGGPLHGSNSRAAIDPPPVPAMASGTSSPAA